ncbi:MAG: type II toxin-antitoxin system YafQ family toxin [Betaproteobacteria bacterium]|nr:type II toxin-antitoxin system YafQ family toxin [Betaproteobacteria bacterium]MSQ87903.1 type II toxin-antitoxin system YafQ family toxin [Betaproteobacteria bacterium]
MKEIVFTRRFERDFRRLKRKIRRHALDYESLEYIFELLQDGKPLPQAFREHPLDGDFAGFTECHVDADWLLIYRILRHRVVLYRTGTHRDLFRARRGS